MQTAKVEMKEGITNEHLLKMKEALSSGSRKVDNLFAALKSIETMHAETSDGFSETLVRAYGKILENDADGSPTKLPQGDGTAVAA